MRKTGYQCHYFEAEEQDIISLNILENHLKKLKPHLLSISHVQFSTGFKIDLEQVASLCKQYGTKLILDATQSFGAYPIDVLKQGIDVFVSSVYKWTTAGFGLGICYINPTLFEDCHPFLAGNNAVGQAIINQEKSALENKKAAFETGHTNFPAMVTLNSALKELTQIGIANIAERIDVLVDDLLTSLSTYLSDAAVLKFPKKNRSGIFSIDVKEALVHQLSSKKIITSYRNKGLRVSVHFYNNKKDVDAFNNALKVLA